MTLPEYMESSVFPNFDTKEQCLAYVDRNTWMDKQAATQYVEDHFDGYKKRKQDEFFVSAREFADFMANVPKPKGSPYMKDRINSLTRKK